MNKGIVFTVVFAILGMSTALAADARQDLFKGKLFPPNVILEHQADLDLSKAQFKAIRAAVVEVQAGVAEHEWDMKEAYQALMQELDKAPVDEERVLAEASKALLAENQVKKKQMAMMVRLKNLLTEEQVNYLRSVQQ